MEISNSVQTILFPAADEQITEMGRSRIKKIVTARMIRKLQ